MLPAGLIETLVADSLTRSIPELTPRDTRLPSLAGKIDAIVGMRRSGKTYLLYQEMRRLLARKVPRERLLHLSFEDERLQPLTEADLAEIPEAYYRRHPEARRGKSYFFFDEVQNVPSWERFVRRLLDQENAAIVVTGSSSRLLSKEIATSLRGRSLATELLPFSFAEALRHGGVEAPRKVPTSAERSHLERALSSYLETGGFPEVQGLDVQLSKRVLLDYVDVVLYRDVAERHAVTNLQALRWLERALLANPGGLFSVNRFFNDLKSQGIGIGKDGLHALLHHLEDAYLLFTIPVHTHSVRARQVNPRKCYPIDPGLSRVVSPREPGRGHLLETVVYLELRRRGNDMSYLLTPEGFEVDFRVEGPDGTVSLVQVSADHADPATRDRELRALESAMAATRLAESTLVTLHETGTKRLSSGTVTVVPAWRFLLDK